MGTSTSYPGPTRTPALLPPWAVAPLPSLPPPPEAEPLPEAEQPAVLDVLAPEAATEATSTTLVSVDADGDFSWKGPKSTLTSRARGSTRSSFRTIGRGYVRASGGARRATATARAGRAMTGRLGGFLVAGLRDGFIQAAQQLGLQNLVGRDAQFILASFIDLLAPPGALREEAIARQAMIETLADWFDQIDVAANGLSALDALTPALLGELIALSITNYINARFQQELVSRIEQGTLAERAANQLATEVKSFIAAMVQLDLTDIDLITIDWEGTDGQERIANLYESAYALLGDAL